MTTQTPDSVREALEQRKAINTVLGRLLAPLVPDVVERIRIGNEACTAILAALDSRAGEGVRPDSWAATPDEVRERAQLLADMELHLKSSRIFITTREKMHPCGVELHDELLGRVTAAIDSIGKAKGHD